MPLMSRFCPLVRLKPMCFEAEARLLSTRSQVGIGLRFAVILVMPLGAVEVVFIFFIFFIFFFLFIVPFDSHLPKIWTKGWVPSLA